MRLQWHRQLGARVVLVVILLILTLPAAVAQGPGPGPGPGGDGVQQSDLSTFVSNDFAGSGNCATCHSALVDSAGNDVSMDAHWRSTMMANASKDPLWQAKIESEVARNPSLQAVIEDKCSRCHTPMARVQAVADGSGVAVLGDGFLSPVHPLNAAAMDGVSCSVCHQIRNVGLGQPPTFTGNYVIDTSTAAPDRLIYAKFANPMRSTMRMQVGYTPVQGAQTTLSGLCATCHMLYTPAVDAQGNLLGEFPEQMTYLEWEHSADGDGVQPDRSCQACHLPPAVGRARLANRPRRLPARSPFEQHHFVGGNALLLGILQSHLGELGVTASPAHLDATMARLHAQMENQSAALGLVSSQVTNGTLEVVVAVQNLAGHKLPTGIPARRAWLHTTVTDAAGTVVFDSGQPLADGRIEGDDADATPGAFEPHYDRITSPGQVQIYEPVMLDSDGQVTYTLLRALSYAKDNRLLPRGFSKETAVPDITVWGAAAADDDFVGGSDRVTYAIDVQGRPGPLAVSVRLLYQATSFSFVRDLGQTPGELVQRFAGYYDQADKSPLVMASLSATVR